MTKLWMPDDVWLEILANHVPLAYAPGSLELWQILSNLSLTCWRLRRIALPAVYHSLTFRLNREDTQQGGLRAMRSVLRAEFRANCLSLCPHLLRNVREFTLTSWDPKILGPSSPDEHSAAENLWCQTREDRWWTAYDAVTDIILQMPGLRKLRVLGSAVTYRLHLSIGYHRSLQTLVLSPDNGYQYCHPSLQISKPPLILSPVEEPPIRHLDLIGLDAWDESVDYPDYFTEIFRYCPLEILSMKIYFPHLHHAFSAIANLSSLRSLTVELPDPAKYPNFSTLRRILTSSPALQSLEFVSKYKWSTNVGLHRLPGDALPKLAVISGNPEIVIALISGRPVQTIHLKVHAPEALESFDIPASSAAQVHTLEMDADTSSLHDFLTVAQFPSRFINLTHLKVRYRCLARHRRDAWGDAETRDETISLTYTETLSRLPWLQVCWNISRNDGSTHDHVAAEGEFLLGDPAARGHPSLEEISVIQPTIWRWYHGEGWTRRILPRHLYDT